MDRQKRFDRRTMLELTAAAGAAMAIAGCGGPAEDAEETDPEEEPEGDVVEEEEAEEPEEEVPDDEEDDEEDEVVDDEEEEEEEVDEEEEEDDEDEWEDVEEILLDGYTAGWEGVEPGAIEGEENPTLVLYEGREYDITWENADGDQHNIEIWDEDEEIVDDYETEIIEEEGETQTLTIEATDEMDAYVCVVHIGTMLGDIEIRSEDEGEEEDDEEADDGGNEGEDEDNDE